jgi:hypothetical protein
MIKVQLTIELDGDDDAESQVDPQEVMNALVEEIEGLLVYVDYTAEAEDEDEDDTDEQAEFSLTARDVKIVY